MEEGSHAKDNIHEFDALLLQKTTHQGLIGSSGLQGETSTLHIK